VGSHGYQGDSLNSMFEQDHVCTESMRLFVQLDVIFSGGEAAILGRAPAMFYCTGAVADNMPDSA